MQSIEDKIIARIYGKGRGWSFCPKDFQDIATRSAVDQALSRLHRKGTVRRVLRGIYDYPRRSKALDMQASPDVDQVAHAVARRLGWQIQATGAWAENLIGLSTQVPAIVEYLTSGRAMTFEVDGTEVEFRPVAHRDLEPGKYGLIIQALKSLGKAHIDEHIIRYLQKMLSSSDCRKLLKRKQTTGWVYEVIKKICEESRA